MRDLVRAMRGDGMQTPPGGKRPDGHTTPGGTSIIPQIANGWIALRARAAAAKVNTFNPHTPSAPHRGGSDSSDSAS